MEKMLHFQFEKYKRPEDPSSDGWTEFYQYECKNEVLNTIKKYCEHNPEAVLCYSIEIPILTEKPAKVKMSRQERLEQEAIQKEKTNAKNLRLLKRLIKRYGHDAIVRIESDRDIHTTYKIEIEGMTRNSEENRLFMKKAIRYFMDWEIFRPFHFEWVDNQNKITLNVLVNKKFEEYKKEIDEMLWNMNFMISKYVPSALVSTGSGVGF